MKLRVKRLITFLIVFFMFFSINIIDVNAKENITIKSVELKEKTQNVETSNIDLNNYDINTNITFNKINDFVTYKIIIKNDSYLNYKIDSISDNNKNKYITTSYKLDSNELKKKGEVVVFMTLKYTNNIITDHEEFNYKTIININYKDGGKTTISLNPKTGDNIFIYILLGIISLLLVIVLIYKFKNKKSINLLLLFILIIPFSVFADSKKIIINFNSFIEINRNEELYTITFNPNGGSSVENIYKIENQKIGTLPTTNKPGYEFLGWFTEIENGEKISSDTVITDNTTYYAHWGERKLQAIFGDGTNIGDELKFDDEYYYVINYDASNDTVTIIPKYVLDVSTDKYKQDSTDLGYSSNNGIPFDEANNRNDSYCSEPSMGCNIYQKDNRTNKDATIKAYVDNYKNQLVEKNMIRQTDNVRLINLDDFEKLGYDLGSRDHPVSENKAPYFMYNTASYWTGEAKSGSIWDVWFIYKEGELSYNNASAGRTGFRPVIEIKRDKIKVKDKKKFRYSTWIWQESLDQILSSSSKIDESVDLLEEIGINEVYLSILPDDLNNNSSVEYISKLNKKGIRVYALYGDPIFVIPSYYDDVINYDLQAIYNFNRNHLGTAHLEGLHYDVEYHSTKYDGTHYCPDGETEEAKRCVSRRYFVQFVKTSYLKAKELNLKVDYDITVYNTNLTSYYEENGTTAKNLLDEIIDYADNLTIMAYGNGTRNTTDPLLFKGTYNYGDSTITVDKTMVEKLNEHNLEVTVGQELEVFKNTAEELKNDPSLGPIYLPEYERDGHTIYKYTWEFVNEVIDEIETKLYQEGANKVSFTIHDYKQLIDLYKNRKNP